MANNPFHDSEEQPILDDLLPILGPRLQRIFDKIYNEIATLGYVPILEWDGGAGTWFFRYYKEKKKIFDIYVSDDQFYALMILSSEDFLKVTHHSESTEATSKLIHKFPENQSLHTVRIEATLEKMNEQEGFFDLLPILAEIYIG